LRTHCVLSIDPGQPLAGQPVRRTRRTPSNDLRLV